MNKLASLMKTQSTVTPKQSELAKDVSRADVLKAAQEFLRTGMANDRSEALSQAWECFRLWKLAKEREETAERARFFRNFKRRQKAKVWGGVTEREGGAMSRGLSWEHYSKEEIAEERRKRMVAA